ncbi:MAG TPA: alkaline phosphatase family protein [Thermoanaerobaculia bacterium]|nr:alkaline phosphatase family protein [Thermoanaerobaculia bacterium]
MPTLKSIRITFNTHNDSKDKDTVLHVFVKNRSNNSSTPESDTDYISNYLAYQRYDAAGFSEINPYLGYAPSLSQGVSLGDPSSKTFNIPLRARPIPLEEIVLPVVNIHILPHGNDRWIFSYTIVFLFDDGRSFSAASNTNGVTGIILDQDNRSYSGICVENPFITLPPLVRPDTDAVLTRIVLAFGTHHDSKDGDTTLNVHIVNRLNATTSQDLAIGTDLLKGQDFPDSAPTGRADSPSDKHVVFTTTTVPPLASSSIRLRDIVLPVVNINIAPNGHDRWIFDYRVTYEFNNGQAFTSQTNGIILDQDNHKHASVYQGTPFPIIAPPVRAQLTPAPVDHVSPPKTIPLALLRRKLDELINNRQGLGSQYPPLRKIRLHNTGVFGVTLPESYLDLQSIDAAPPPPGAILPVNVNEGVKYDSSPSSLGQLLGTAGIGDLYLNDIKSKALTVHVDGSSPTPLVLEIDFDTSGHHETIGGIGGMDFTLFTVSLHLTLAFDSKRSRIDTMAWVDDIDNVIYTFVANSNPASYEISGQFLGKPLGGVTLSPSDFKSSLVDRVIHVNVVTTKALDPGGIFQKQMRGTIFDTLSKFRHFTQTTLRDDLNSTVNSWLLGGIIEGASGCLVKCVKIDGDNLVISYTGPWNNFAPAVPAGWPTSTSPNTAVDFSPGTLANIDHIVVLTMENRSFDHMLGYLSLPPAQGGLGRIDVDGLKGNEFNLHDGRRCPSFAFQPGETIFAPDPPHSHDPVHQAIGGGKMDGFVRTYADAHGLTVGPRIMGHQPAANVPTYDAMARDFALGHRWFASHPGPTFCNRFYELTGHLNIDPQGFWEFSNSSPLRPVFTKTIFDFLSEQKVSWRYFEHGYCFLRFFESHTFNATNIATFDDPVVGFLNLARTGNLPSVTFIDPHFIELPPDGNCDGPPADIKEGQQLVRKIVEAVVTSPQWSKTLLIVIYDEHGGFYDHVPPPAAAKVSPESLPTYGVRVPAFIVSPWIKPGTVFGKDGPDVAVGRPTGTAAAADRSVLRSLHFDHTSILKTIARRFMSKSPPYMGGRYAQANDLSSVIGTQLHTSQFLPFIPYNLVYDASKKRLDVQGASFAPGTILWHFDANDTVAQQFSFEDAGDGCVFIRTHTGNLYLTADPSLAVKQQPKNSTGLDFQRWRLSPSSISVAGRNNFTISNAAIGEKVLQPSGNSLSSGVAVVLGPPEAAHAGPVGNRNPWHVSSPLISEQIVAHP